jgi:NAD(P)-dependent dehydrogenase (short-subunit alcohol dehydrogenase family)
MRAALVTGGTSGIGLACARMLRRDGYGVAICGRNEGRLERASAELGEQTLAQRCDVARRDEVERLVAATVERFGGLDVVVACAGVGAFGQTVEQIGDEDWARVLAVNLTGAMHTLAACAAELRRRRGYAFTVSSVAGKQGMPGSGAYSASKWGLLGLTHSFIREEARHGVRATAICPGMVDTPMIGARRGGELLAPEDVAQTVRYCLGLSPVALVREIVLERTAVA